MNEKHLLVEIKNGSIESFNELYKRWVSKLHTFVYCYVKSEAIADDIVQETFLRIWINRYRLDLNCSFKSYLFTISYRLLLKELRRMLNNPLIEEYVEYEKELSISGRYIEVRIDFERFQMELAKSKGKLSPRQREIFELNKEQGFSISDIATQFSISEQVVRNQLSASLKVIRGELQSYACF